MDGKKTNNYNRNNNDDSADDENVLLSEHSKSMRDAFTYCLDLFDDDKIQHQIHDISSSPSSSYVSKDIINMALDSSNNHQKLRTETYAKFWSTATTTTPPEIPHNMQYGDIGLDKDEQRQQAINFRRQFHNQNVPCLITGLDATAFQYVNRHWIMKRRKSE